jgi:hypothetical protein
MAWRISSLDIAFSPWKGFVREFWELAFQAAVQVFLGNKKATRKVAALDRFWVCFSDSARSRAITAMSAMSAIASQKLKANG